MDAKFLTVTGLLGAAAFGAVWFLAAPVTPDGPTTPDRDIAIQAHKPHPRFTVEAPPQDPQPSSAVEETNSSEQ